MEFLLNPPTFLIVALAIKSKTEKKFSNQEVLIVWTQPVTSKIYK